MMRPRSEGRGGSHRESHCRSPAPEPADNGRPGLGSVRRSPDDKLQGNFGSLLPRVFDDAADAAPFAGLHDIEVAARVAPDAVIRAVDRIGSPALRADAVESIICGYLSGLVVLGLVALLLMPRWWWVDSVTSLAVVVLLVKEGREAWDGDQSEAME
jgi:hypothetical protein